MSKKKLLIREVFEQGKKESGKDSKNGIALYLILYFEENLGFSIVEKTLVRYYDTLIRDNKEDYNIDFQTLDKLSEYLGFRNFGDFCKTENFTKTNLDSSFTNVKVSIDESERSLTEKLSQIVVNITTTPIFKLPEFLTKQSNLGMIGVVVCAGFLGNKIYNSEKASISKTFITDSLISKVNPSKENATAQNVVYVPQTLGDFSEKNVIQPEVLEKQCMYWDGKEFVPEDCHKITEYPMEAIDWKKVQTFKKITTPDTITAKSMNKVWYSKYQNEVEFFTADGKNPENYKELHPLTAHILNKYILSKN